MGDTRLESGVLSTPFQSEGDMKDAGDIGLPDGWRDGCIAWAQSNGSLSELWLFGSRGPKGGACFGSDVDIGIALMPPICNNNWAYGNYQALGDTWQGELERIVGRHVSLEAMLPGNEGNAIIRSTGVCLWRFRGFLSAGLFDFH
jgi:hypothetical protein